MLHDFWMMVKHILDGLSIGATILAIMKVIPYATTVLAFFWICIRLYETRTVQYLLSKNKYLKRFALFKSSHYEQ